MSEENEADGMSILLSIGVDAVIKQDLEDTANFLDSIATDGAAIENMDLTEIGKKLVKSLGVQDDETTKAVIDSSRSTNEVISDTSTKETEVIMGSLREILAMFKRTSTGRKGSDYAMIAHANEFADVDVARDEALDLIDSGNIFKKTIDMLTADGKYDLDDAITEHVSRGAQKVLTAVEMGDMGSARRYHNDLTEFINKPSSLPYYKILKPVELEDKLAKSALGGDYGIKFEKDTAAVTRQTADMYMTRRSEIYKGETDEYKERDTLDLDTSTLMNISLMDNPLEELQGYVNNALSERKRDMISNGDDVTNIEDNMDVMDLFRDDKEYGMGNMSFSGKLHRAIKSEFKTLNESPDYYKRMFSSRAWNFGAAMTDEIGEMDKPEAIEKMMELLGDDGTNPEISKDFFDRMYDEKQKQTTPQTLYKGIGIKKDGSINSQNSLNDLSENGTLEKLILTGTDAIVDKIMDHLGTNNNNIMVKKIDEDLVTNTDISLDDDIKKNFSAKMTDVFNTWEADRSLQNKSIEYDVFLRDIRDIYEKKTDESLSTESGI